MLLATVLVRAESISPTEAQKIDHLIRSIEALDTALFIRNGTAYGAKAAADHLRLKLRTAGSRVRTADDFIRLCATASSVSGKPYLIRFVDGHEVTTAAFLQDELREYEEQHEGGV